MHWKGLRINDIKSDSTCLTSPTTGEGEEGADLLVRSCLGASGDFTAQSVQMITVLFVACI